MHKSIVFILDFHFIRTSGLPAKSRKKNVCIVGKVNEEWHGGAGGGAPQPAEINDGIGFVPSLPRLSGDGAHWHRHRKKPVKHFD